MNKGFCIFLRQQTLSQTDLALPHRQAYKDIKPFLPFQAFPLLQGSFGNFTQTKETSPVQHGKIKT